MEYGIDDKYDRSSTQQSSRRSSEHLKGWDVFIANSDTDEQHHSTSKAFIISLKLLKVLIAVATFIVVLCCSVASKAIMLLTVTQIRNETVAVCVSGRSDLNTEIHTLNFRESKEKYCWIWSAFFMLIVPDVITFIRSVRICLFKSLRQPTKGAFLFILVTETLHTIGLGVLHFMVLPRMHLLNATLISCCVAFIPNLLNTISSSTQDKNAVAVVLNVMSTLIQLFSSIAWISSTEQSCATKELIITPIALVLISFGFTENFINCNSEIRVFKTFLYTKEAIRQSRYTIYLFVSIWKIVVLLAVILIIESAQEQRNEISILFDHLSNLFSDHQVILKNAGLIEEINTLITIPSSFHVRLILMQAICSWICYVFCKFASRICIQTFSYTLPICLTTPLLLSLFATICHIYSKQSKCHVYFLFDILDSGYFHLRCPSNDFWSSNEFYVFIVIWLFVFLSQTWTTIHLWNPGCERLATTEKLFVTPMYCSGFIDQSLLLNRTRAEDDIKNDEDLDYEFKVDEADENRIYPSDRITRIFACATMWHETRDEMKQFLKSIMKMDEDQCARESVQKYLRLIDPDYYKLETHIFFDDAFEASDDIDERPVVNCFVKQFIDVVDEAASDVHRIRLKVRRPKKIITPYGGRLEWILPGKTKLFVHLKDKCKIRHRKRWSQVMYMYYLLGHRLMEIPIDVNRKAVRAENTYILALDGDIIFEPSAVRLLVDLMKKNPNLGAACGRVHPIGSGPMVWYQKFEYAISHWLQKAAEHVFGCVLCSPGCFSLFRSRALMSDNVLRRYTTKSEEPVHYVQFDQGEDRWLCTLLLKSGYRVEYNAASDAYTHCPEGFAEFYTQRRRWGPSTLANILDLLQGYKQVVKVNRDISMPYIIYQCVLMLGTLMSPGTIFLMLVGAVNSVLNVPNLVAFVYNLIPLLLFIIMCFTMKNDYQIFFAQILSAGYGLLMTAVFVGTAIEFTEHLYSPSTVFFIVLIGSFLITALLHPQEFSCFLPFPLYLLSIPSMYMLLTIYSFINLHIVAWGTREVQSKKSQAKDTIKSPKSQHWNRDGLSSKVSNLFKCWVCVKSEDCEEKMALLRIEEHLNEIHKKVNLLTGNVANNANNSNMYASNTSLVPSECLAKTESQRDIENDSNSNERTATDWIDDNCFHRCDTQELTESERSFWIDLIEKYLYPIEDDADHKQSVTVRLKDLRNRVVFGILMLNSIFVLTVFLLQMHKDKLAIKLPKSFTTSYDGEQSEENSNSIEPVASSFILLFGVILVLQVIGMLIHRFSTFSHIMAFLRVDFCQTSVDKNVDDNFVNENNIEIIKNLQSLKGVDEESAFGHEDEVRDEKVKRKNTVFTLEKRKTEKQKTMALDVAFRKRFFKIYSHRNSASLELNGSVSPKITLTSLRRREDSFSYDTFENHETLEEPYSLRASEKTSSRGRTMFAKFKNLNERSSHDGNCFC